jgi:hypothetical protein
MKYKIYFENKDSEQDCIFIEGESLVEVKSKTYAELNKRGVRGLCSEKIED